MAKEFITCESENEEAWVCICGNTPTGGGFYACDQAGNEVEPTVEAWTTDLLVCAECGRMINQYSLEVVGRNPVPKFL